MGRILEDAIYKEIGARNFYKRIAGAIKNHEGKKRFETLSNDEDGHRVKLIRWYKEFAGSDFIEDPKAVEKAEVRDIDVSERTSAVKALDIAVEAEAEAETYYRGQAEKATRDDFKELLLQLADEESGHRALLEAERNSLVGGFYWFDMDSTSFLED